VIKGFINLYTSESFGLVLYTRNDSKTDETLSLKFSPLTTN